MSITDCTERDQVYSSEAITNHSDHSHTWYTLYIGAVPEIILGGGWATGHFFVLWGEGVLLMCLRGGGGLTCPGGQGVLDP